MATLTVTQLSPEATDPGFVAAADAGDQFLIDAEVVLHVRNASAAEVTVTLASQVTDDIGVGGDDMDITVAAAEEQAVYLGNYAARFRDSDGYCQVTYSAHEDVTVAVYRT
jgi:hypothetical protein